jgi:hypothetical protein
MPRRAAGSLSFPGGDPPSRASRDSRQRVPQPLDELNQPLVLCARIAGATAASCETPARRPKRARVDTASRSSSSAKQACGACPASRRSAHQSGREIGPHAYPRRHSWKVPPEGVQRRYRRATNYNRCGRWTAITEVDPRSGLPSGPPDGARRRLATHPTRVGGRAPPAAGRRRPSSRLSSPFAGVSPRA